MIRKKDVLDYRTEPASLKTPFTFFPIAIGRERKGLR
jgi:hypothetical protein